MVSAVYFCWNVITESFGVSWSGEIVEKKERWAIVLLVSAQGSPLLSILHTYIWRMWWKGEGDHFKRHQQEELVSVSEEEKRYFIFFRRSSSLLLLIAFFRWSFFTSLPVSLYPSVSLSVTGKYGTLALTLQKIEIIKACLHASQYCLWRSAGTRIYWKHKGGWKYCNIIKLLNSVVVVRKRTIPTERQPLVGQVSANLWG
jgi:hypothetical protein